MWCHRVGFYKFSHYVGLSLLLIYWNYSCQVHLQNLMDTCVSAGFDTYLHSPCGNILSLASVTLKFSSDLYLFLLIPFADSSSSNQLEGVGFFQGSLGFTFCTLTVGGLMYSIGFKTIDILLAPIFLSPTLTLFQSLVWYIQLLTQHFPNISSLTHSQWNTWFPPIKLFLFPFT